MTTTTSSTRTIAFFLAAGVHMQGNVTVPGLAIVEGHFKGHLSADTVIVKAGGVVEGTVQADSLQVHGKIIGDVSAGLAAALRILPVATQAVARVKPAARVASHPVPPSRGLQIHVPSARTWQFGVLNERMPPSRRLSGASADPWSAGGKTVRWHRPAEDSGGAPAVRLPDAGHMALH